jgi:NADPH:quinone reductase-like Zn-dependent oxidoreductase
VLRSLRYGAAVAASGLTGGSTFESSVFPFIVRNTSLIGIDTVRTPIAQRRRVWAEIAIRFPVPALEAVVDSEVGLEAVAPALDAIQAGTVRGRILVTPYG